MRLNWLAVVIFEIVRCCMIILDLFGNMLLKLDRCSFFLFVWKCEAVYKLT